MGTRSVENTRIIARAITPNGHSHACLARDGAQDGAGTVHGWKPIDGWKSGNTIDVHHDTHTRTRRGCRN
nr:hypothetical protein [Peristeroidobacter soli]